ncbi:MAG: hypothetical protein LBN00_10795 [Oscillospiraceae bacterium]|nr:hypothetical protein [Oscillospiraceae bacterium]
MTTKTLTIISTILVLIFISFILPHLIIKFVTHIRLKRNPQYVVDNEKQKKAESAVGGVLELIVLTACLLVPYISSGDKASSVAELKDKLFGLSLLFFVTSAILLIFGFVNYKKWGFGVEPAEAQKKYKHMLRGSCFSVFGAIVLFLISRFVG